MSGRRLCALLASILAVGLATAIPATAEFGPIRLVSRGPAQQADFAVNTALSADGRYLAFSAKLGAREGVFREDLSSGAITAVVEAPISSSTADRFAPSISANGRYVSFTTTARLDPDDDNAPGSSDVYVADMEASPPGYELASALDGCDPSQPDAHPACGLTYAGGGGSEASGRVALSADGRRLVFVTSTESDLTSGPGDSTEGVPTPPRQVVLRDLDTDRTTLVSVERDSGGAMTQRPVPGGALMAKPELSLLRGAAISADGTTIAWIGANLPAQVPLAEPEATRIAQLDAGTYPYDEPLWRRVADGPEAPTLRLVAGGNVELFPGMFDKSTEFNLAEGWVGVSRVNGVPRLSADGRTVVMIGNPNNATNVFTVAMGPGSSGAQAVRQLTREIAVDAANPVKTINNAPYLGLTGHVFDLGISADGRRIALTTARQVFPLAPPNLIGTAPASLGLTELYLVDLERETLQRLTHGLAGPGDPSNNLAALASAVSVTQGQGATSPSLGMGGLVAFASNASNLVPGDGNEDSDAFVITDGPGTDGAGADQISSPPARSKKRKRWQMTLTAFSKGDGTVRIVAGVPAAGRLSVRAKGEPRSAVGARRLVAAKAKAIRGGAIAIELQLPRRIQHLARTREGIYGLAKVRFKRKGRKVLRGQVQIRFRAHATRGRGG